jgi:RHS repeat-associated protein
VWKWDQQEPFGVNVPDENPSGLGAFDLPLRLPGQYFDKETNLHYNYFRDYDPSLGRYVESDPIGLDGGLNTYAYVRSHPLAFFDPDGLEVRFICRRLREGLAYTGFQHCFIHVTCPEEGWASTLSLYGGNGLWPRAGYKSANEGPDDPNAQGQFNQPVTPNQCFGDPCAYEKAVIRRFNSFPGGLVPYSPTGPNSNSFAAGLITGNQYGGALPAGAPGGIAAPGINQPHPSFPR